MKNNLSSLKEEAVTEVVVAMAEGVVVDTEVVAMEVEVAAMEAVAAVMEVVVGVVATSFAFSLDCILKNVSNMEDNKTLAQLNIDLLLILMIPESKGLIFGIGLLSGPTMYPLKLLDPDQVPKWCEVLDLP